MAVARRPRQRSRWRLALAVACLMAAPAAVGQSQSPVQFDITLAQDSSRSGSRAPIARATRLLEDDRWRSVLQGALPLRLHFRIELWRTRSVWFDEFRRQVEWDVVVRREPLLDQYSVVTITPGGATERRYATVESLAAALSYAYRITMEPADQGTFYYTGALGISTLSESDLEEVERFLRGDLGPAAAGGKSLGQALSEGAQRLLLRLAGVPSVSLEARSARFSVR